MLIGILPLEQAKARTLAIARGEYKPAPDEPKVWFNSMDNLARVLSDDNRQLLDTIASHHFDSLTDLAEATGRQQGNLSRTLKTMEQFGLVKIHKTGGNRISPEVLATSFDIKVGGWGFMDFVTRT